jgi:hypothetical protein
MQRLPYTVAKDRPRDGQRCLVWNRFLKEWAIAYFREDGWRYMDNGMMYRFRLEPVYWLPLPGEPKDAV